MATLEFKMCQSVHQRKTIHPIRLDIYQVFNLLKQKPVFNPQHQPPALTPSINPQH